MRKVGCRYGVQRVLLNLPISGLNTCAKSQNLRPSYKMLSPQGKKITSKLKFTFSIVSFCVRSSSRITVCVLVKWSKDCEKLVAKEEN